MTKPVCKNKHSSAIMTFYINSLNECRRFGDGTHETSISNQTAMMMDLFYRFQPTMPLNYVEVKKSLDCKFLLLGGGGGVADGRWLVSVFE